MRKKIICIVVLNLLFLTSFSALGNEADNIVKEDPKPFGILLAFGTSVDVKIIQLEPGEDYVDLEVLNKPFYVWDQEMITFNPGVFLRLYEAKGLFTPSLPFCIGICNDYGIIG
jgi:hypothetical protein